MRPKRSLSGLSIWLSCSIFVVAMTVGIALITNKYGSGYVLFLLVGAGNVLQLYKHIYQGIAYCKPYCP